MSGQGGMKTITILEGDRSVSESMIQIGAKSRNVHKLAVKESPDGATVLSYKRLVVPPSMRSIYWKCFGFPANRDNEILCKSKVVCLLCKSTLSYNRNTSNLRMHLQKRHAAELETLELVQPTPNCKSGATDRRSAKKPHGAHLHHHMRGTKIPKQEPTVVQVFPVTPEGSEEQIASSSSLPHFITDVDDMHPLRVIVKEATSNQSYNLVDGKLVADAIAEFIIMDMQHPDIVESKGFQRLLATLKSPCEIPSKSRLVDEIIPKMYETVKDHLQPEISALSCDISLSVEDWLASSGDVYSTLSVHYITTSETELQTRVLSTIYCSEVDALHWGAQFDAVMDEWDIKLERIKAVLVSSERDDVLDSLLARGFIIIPCLSHTIQTACTKACFSRPEVVEILNKCRAMVAFISRHQAASEALKYQENILQLEEGSLQMDFPCNWVTTFTLLEQLCARRDALPSVLEHLSATLCPTASLELNETQWNIIEDLINVLEPFKVTMVTMSEEKSSIISILKPIMWQLLNVHLERSDTDSPHMTTFKTKLVEILTEKYRDEKVTEVMELATALDPRFKNLPFMSELDKPLLLKKLRDKLNFEANGSQSEVAKETANKKPRISGIEFLLGDLYVIKPEVSSNQRLEMELVQYECESPANLEKSPLEWWKETGGKCSQLSKLAFQYLCVPVCANNANSSAHQKPPLSSFSPQLAQKLIFLHRNYNPQ